MAGQDEAASKELDPTPRKLDQARKKGDIAQSSDLHVASAYLGLLVALGLFGLWSATYLGRTLVVFLDLGASSGPELFQSAAQVSGQLIRDVLVAAAPLALLPALGVIASVLAQQSFTFVPSKLVPKASRISPVENSKNKWGANGIFEFAKNSAKLLVFSVVLAVFLLVRTEELVTLAGLGPATAVVTMGSFIVDFLLVVFVVAGAIGAIDMSWQRAHHRRRNRMSRKELQDENKETEGDPHLKQERRARAQEIAMNRMLADVPGASVVIVNPTHYAVALEWTRTAPGAPVCVAKGIDHVAARIREIAEEAGVAVYRDPPTARVIYRDVAVGQAVLPRDYRAVAVAIRYAESLLRKSKWRPGKT